MNSTMLDDRVTKLESMWKAGSGKLEHDYFVGASNIGNDLVGIDQGVANPVALTLLRNIFAKTSNSPKGLRDADFEVGSSDLEAIQTLARYMVNHDVVQASTRNEKLVMLARTLGNIRSELQPNYVNKRVYENVMPPSGTGMRIAGANPESIADPVAREKYQAAIRQNQLSNLSNKRQSALVRMEGELAPPIVEYLARIAASDASGKTAVRNLAAVARLTKSERTRVLGQ